ncbi:MAG: hypothetical protein IPK13_09560 [Deltaproteobacteria bacterium]|nr:hypothetical protein [Deltaproteobacteria bacterium]
MSEEEAIQRMKTRLDKQFKEIHRESADWENHVHERTKPKTRGEALDAGSKS